MYHPTTFLSRITACGKTRFIFIGASRSSGQGDSKSLVFADEKGAEQAIVLVQVGEQDLKTLVHPVALHEVCAMLSDASITAPRYGVVEIQAAFHAEGSTPCNTALTLHEEDFKPAMEELYVVPKKEPSVRKK